MNFSKLKFVTISNTNGQHHKLCLPKGNVLIHAGDVSRCGKETEVIEFLDWFAQQDFKHKILIAGNGEFYFERTPGHEIEKVIPANGTYLNDSSITINGINIWGSSITPWFLNWAVNRHREHQNKNAFGVDTQRYKHTGYTRACTKHT